MTKNIKKTLALILSVIMLVSVMPMTVSFAASGTTADGFAYVTTGSTAMITGYSGSATEVVIPEKVSVYTVVAIGDDNSYAPFLGNTKITSVVIPDTVLSIGSGAFMRCTNLQTVTIGSGLKTVGNNAFKYCTKITTVNYKGSKTQWEDSIAWGSIGNNVVTDCENIVFYYGIECGDSNHLTTFVARVDATCTTNGAIAHWACEVCKKTFSNEAATEEITDLVIPAAHTLTKFEASEPNCAEEGNVAYWNCSVCGKNYADETATNELENVTLETNSNHNYPENWTYNAETGKHEKVCANDATHILVEDCADSDTDGDCVCDACGELVEHNYSVANCTTAATCSVCGKVSGEIDSNNHSLTYAEANDYTCTTNGNLEYWYCSRCENYFKNADATEAYAENEWVVPAKHDEKWVSAKEPTCAEAGYKGHWLCKVCGLTFADKSLTQVIDIVKPATGNHTYDDGAETTAPGCTTTGIKTYTCTLEGCGASYTEVIDATGHTFGAKKSAKAATCVANGYDSYKQCTVCTKYFAADAEVTSTDAKDDKSAFDTPINPDAHSFSKSFSIDQKASCTADGSKSKHCTRSGCTATTEVTAIAKREHTLADTTQVTAPTCTEVGTMGQECTNEATDEYEACEYTTTRDIDATGHTPSENQVIPATCTTEGYEGAVICTVPTCRAIISNTKVIAPLGHDWEELEGHLAATCTEAGKNNLRCKNPGCGITDTSVVPASHTYPENWDVITEAGCTTAGVQIKDCTKCDDTSDGVRIKEPIPATGHKFGDITEAVVATCAAGGNDAYKQCTVCSKYFAADAAVDSVAGVAEASAFNTAIDDTNHDFATDFTIDKQATCTEDGSKSKHCSRCVATTDVTTIEKRNHALADTTEAATPTCTAVGTMNQKCTNEEATAEYAACDYTTTREIPALGHNFATTYTVDEKATCDANGSKSMHCSRCAAKTGETVILKRDHVIEDASIKTPANCLNAGVMNQKCTNVASDEYAACTYTTTRPISATGHTFGAVTVATAATCSAEGNHAYKLCGGCNLYFAENATNTSDEGKLSSAAFAIAINAANHIGTTYSSDENISEATCKSVKTWDEVTRCSGCRAELGRTSKSGTEFNAANHAGGTRKEVENLVEGTCIEIETWDDVTYCEGCGVELRRVNREGEIDEDNHVGEKTVVSVEVAEGTCAVEASWLDTTYCEDCGNAIAEEIVAGELNPENHVGGTYIQGEDYVPGTCTSVETWNEVTRCGGCHIIFNSIPKTGIKNPDNHNWSELQIPNGGKNMEHYYVCLRKDCGARIDVPHTSGEVNHVNVVKSATCQSEGLQYVFCSICLNDIYTITPKVDHKDTNGDKKCDWCNTSLQTEPSQPDNPQPGTPTQPQDPSANCDCGCHKTGIQKIFFNFKIFFLKFLKLNKTCDCGKAHY